jgi:hypothetical protein
MPRRLCLLLGVHPRYEVPLTIVLLPEFSSSMEVQWSCAIDENSNSTYDMILGRDLQSALRMDILFSTGTLYGIKYPYQCVLGNIEKRNISMSI